MAITSAEILATVQTPSQGGGFVNNVLVAVEMSAAATHPVQPILNLMGGMGWFVSVVAGPSDIALATAAGPAAQPYLTFAAQEIGFRNTGTGALGATNVAFAGGNSLVLECVIVT